MKPGVGRRRHGISSVLVGFPMTRPWVVVVPRKLSVLQKVSIVCRYIVDCEIMKQRKYCTVVVLMSIHRIQTQALCTLLVRRIMNTPCPLPPKSGSRGLSGRSRAGPTLERCNQLAVFSI